MRLTLKSKVLLLAMVPVLLFAWCSAAERC